ncbi:MAG TPA: AbrB/MazE/SpoVT family DNA-binding domain-containing protein [Candidatus Desulfofervidus auxilii]|uniref:AbrB/MazE/SpoVT family DNA-binding domain-containing protein n=1 Tax=Desulfofervidus auxilii TaxID=1621989 RepID=A0A7C0Y2I6_DESA2|nr:AbrB/MazE/SpoVT family DNA-binding domain-containing protein [Candidatus Desulfofervidus auxilii]
MPKLKRKSRKLKSEVKTSTRKILKGSGTYLITLPKDFVKSVGLEAGDEVGVVYDHILKVIPMKEKI